MTNNHPKINSTCEFVPFATLGDYLNERLPQSPRIIGGGPIFFNQSDKPHGVWVLIMGVEVSDLAVPTLGIKRVNS